jgi:manganese/zinc/iron transport system permease protein
MILVDLYLTGLVVAVACAVPGLWLMLRGMSMLSDALTHSVLLGIVLTFLVVGDVDSPFMIFGAVASGVITALFVERLQRQNISADAAIGLVFAGMFSLAIILITVYAGDTHLDLDAVLLGEIIFAPFDRIVVGGVDFGPRAMVMNGIALLLSVSFMIVFWKELLFTTFDATSATLVGFAPAVLTTGLVILSSFTVVTAFDAVGAILVVAFMTTAPASAYLLTYHLRSMVWLTVLLSMSASLIGIWLAILVDVSVSGTMASVAGFQFLMIWLFAPKRGVIARLIERRTLRKEVLLLAQLVHIASHQHAHQRQIVDGPLLQELQRRGWIDDAQQLTASGQRHLHHPGNINHDG